MVGPLRRVRSETCAPPALVIALALYGADVRTIGNLLWIIFAGIWLALGYAIAGLVMCITIIGIPFGIQAFKLAQLSLWPFGRTVVPAPATGGVGQLIANLIWLVLFGWEIFLAHLALGALLCITIVGVPFGIQAFKLSVLALWPFGRTVVTIAEAEAMGITGGLANPADPTPR
jgi:uncharacterized membrane protein YccF (DUF307 family)